MARIKIVEIPQKFVSYWDDQAKCVIDRWQDFHAVTIEDVRSVLVDVIIPFITKKNCEIHIVDNSDANGAFSRETSDYLRTEVSDLMKLTSVRYFVTVSSVESPLANISMRNLSDDSRLEPYIWLESATLEEGLKAVSRLKDSENRRLTSAI